MIAMIPLALQILGLIAPHAGDIVGGIAGMLGGPKASETAKAVVDKATATFGTSDPEQIKLLIAKDATLAQRYIAEVNAEVEVFRIQAQDIQNARARDLAIRNLQTERGVPAGTNPRANVMLAGSFMALVLIIFGIIFYRNSMPDGVLAILNIAVGAILGQIGQAYNFEFGSSRGSAEKNNQIVDMANTAASTAITTAAAAAAARK